MEHTLNRQTTTILTYINQGRRPVAFPVSLPVRPAAGPVWPRSPRPARAAAGRPAGASPAPMGIRRLAPGPVVMAPPIPRIRKDRAPDHRIRIPSVRRSGCGPADTNEHEEGKEGTDGCSNGCERGNTSERRRTRRGGRDARVPYRGGPRVCGGKNEEPPGSPWGLDRGEPYRVKAAARYSPTPSRVQYHRRAGP